MLSGDTYASAELEESPQQYCESNCLLIFDKQWSKSNKSAVAETPVIYSKWQTAIIHILRRLSFYRTVQLHTHTHTLSKQEHSDSANFAKAEIWSGIRIRIFELIRIRMSAGSLSKCIGFIPLSASVISPTIVKISWWLCRRTVWMSQYTDKSVNSISAHRPIRISLVKFMYVSRPFIYQPSSISNEVCVWP